MCEWVSKSSEYGRRTCAVTREEYEEHGVDRMVQKFRSFTPFQSN